MTSIKQIEQKKTVSAAATLWKINHSPWQYNNNKKATRQTNTTQTPPHAVHQDFAQLGSPMAEIEVPVLGKAQAVGLLLKEKLPHSWHPPPLCIQDRSIKDQN